MKLFRLYFEQFVEYLNLKDNLLNLILWNKLFLHFLALNCTRGRFDVVGRLGDLKYKSLELGAKECKKRPSNLNTKKSPQMAMV